MIDLSHTIEDGMVTYRGLPAPVICDFLSREESRAQYEPGTEFQIARIEMVANTGTYVDAPFHRYADGADLADLPLSRLADLDTVVIRWPGDGGRRIGPEAVRDVEVRDRAVLFDTGWSEHWRTDRYFEGHPFLAPETAELLSRSGAALVGIDSLNIDDTGGRARPVHSHLLGLGIPIVEHLCNLRNLPERGARFFAVPPMVRGVGSFPVRAFACLDRRG